MTDLMAITNALLLIAGEDKHSRSLTGLSQISKQMQTTNSDRLSIAILTAGSGIAEALNRIANAIESRD